jgi:hypothetical protein
MSSPTTNSKSQERRKRQQIELERYEAKYIIRPSQVPQIREFVRPFVVDDPHAQGQPPSYIVTTLQLDSFNRSLFMAKQNEVINRFKLRIRTYGLDGACPVFLEIKRKIKGTIVKSRVTLPKGVYGADLMKNPNLLPTLKSSQEEQNFLNFARLTKELNAEPVTRIRYHRESYLGKYDNYSRVTFDSSMQYQMAHFQDWRLLDAPGQWWCMDSPTALNRDFSGVILELKTFSDTPQWMVELTERFDLVRIGFCKYFTALRLESLFEGAAYSEASEDCESR